MDTVAKQLIKNSNSAQILGSGASGEVFKVDDMVVKKLPIEDKTEFLSEVKVWTVFSSNPELRSFLPEYLGSLLKKSDRPPIPTYYGHNLATYRLEEKAYMNSSEPAYYGFIFQKYEPVVNMQDFLDGLDSLIGFEDGYGLFNNLIRGFDIMHKSGYIHRDIKPLNILLRTEDFTHPIIIDFGLVSELPCTDENRCLNDYNSAPGTNYYLPQNMVAVNQRINALKPSFPVKKSGFFNSLKNSIFCRRKTRKNKIQVLTKNIRLRGIFNIQTDNYALAITLGELYKSIDWSEHKEEKELALTTINRFKASVLAFLVAERAPKD